MSEQDGALVATIPKEQALVAFTDPTAFEALFKRVEDEVAKHVPDLTTLAGRKAIASVAFRVSKTKTALVALADELTADARKTVSAVVQTRQEMEKRLDELRDQTRRPLTEWENAEKAREERIGMVFSVFRRAQSEAHAHKSDEYAVVIDKIENIEVSKDHFGDHYDIALSLKDSTLSALREGYARAVVAEENARELDRLRAEAADRANREAEEKAQREADEQHQRDAEAEEKRIADEQAQAEADRQARDDQIREAARQEVERQALEAAEKERAEAQAKLDAATLQREAAERESEELRAREVERERLAEETRKEEEKRLKDRAHRTSVMTAAKLAIISATTTGNEDLEPGRIEAIAITIVRAIVAGEIPAITLAF